MSDNGDASGKFEGFRGVLNDIRLLLADLLGMGKPDAEQQMIIEVFFGMMGYVAKADRLVSSHETDLADAVMDQTDLSMTGRRMAMEAFERGMQRNINVRGELLRFSDAHPAGSEHSERLYNVLVQLAAADGRLNPREHDTLTQVTQELGLPAEALDARLAQYTIKR